jgi:hypothetical protein
MLKGGGFSGKVSDVGSRIEMQTENGQSRTESKKRIRDLHLNKLPRNERRAKVITTCRTSGDGTERSAD